ncbi:MAG TPA: hypothetical protein VGH74_11035 [Planctomycetaceae bacterium]
MAAECLEARALLSNIAVTAQAGVVTLVGDTGDHTLAASVVNGELELTGTNGTTLTFKGTTAATVDVPLPKTLKAIHIDLPGAGNNTVTVDGTGLPKVAGNFSVNLGGGTDSFSLSNTTVKGTVSVNAGNGADTISLSNDKTGEVSIRVGNGADTIQLAGDTTKEVEIKAGNGIDTTSLTNDATGSVSIRTGNGGDTITASNDTSGNVAIRTGSGADSIQLTSDTTGRVAVTSGAGNDSIMLSNVTMQAKVQLGNDDADEGHGDGKSHGDDHGNGHGDDKGDDKGDDHGDDLVDQGDEGEHDDLRTPVALAITTGNGNDTVELDSVVGMGPGSGGSKWQINLGSGKNTLTMNDDTDPGFLNVSAQGTGNDVVKISGSTFAKNVVIALPDGKDHITLTGDTFGNPVFLSTGTGSGSTIAVDDSNFNSLTKFAMAGDNATLNVETAATAGTGTTFQGPVQASLTGASAAVNLGTNTVNDSLVFDKLLKISGGSPAALVTVGTANTTFNGPVVLHNATRVNT